MTNIIINGAAGRMGQTLIKLLPLFPNLRFIGAVDQTGHPFIGKDAGGVKLTSDLGKIIKNCHVVIDFSTAAASVTAAKMAAAASKAMVIGTTGQTAEQKAHLRSAAEGIPIVLSPNMSVGVNLIWKLIELTANTLGKEYAVDIVETHHVNKKDAPSGTAKKIIDIVTSARGHDINKDVFFYEDALDEAPSKKAVSVKSIREGNVIGIHSTFFTSPRDRIDISHNAFTREIFAEGALKAAEWVKGKRPGLYDMQDVLNLR